MPRDPDSEEWSDLYEGVVECECDHCGERHPCRFVPDPFLAEVGTESGEPPESSWWCGPCYDDRHHEV